MALTAKRAYYVALGLTLAASGLAEIFFPSWFAFPATAFLALVWYGVRRPSSLAGLTLSAVTRAETPKGICLGCGYDLRATPDRCPECGMVPKKPPF